MAVSNQPPFTAEVIKNQSAYSSFKNKKYAPLQLYNPTVTIHKINAPEQADNSVRTDKQLTTASAPDKFIPDSSIRYQYPPSINNFNNSDTNTYMVGQAASKGGQQYRPDITSEFPPFAGNQIDSILAIPKLAFYTFYHPFSSLFSKRFNLAGVSALLAANTAEFDKDFNFPNISPYKTKPVIDNGPVIAANDGGTTFGYFYNPEFDAVQQYIPPAPNSPYPNRNYYLQNVDFSKYGTYSSYNWELFFHAPFLIARSLSKTENMRKPKNGFIIFLIPCQLKHRSRVIQTHPSGRYCHLRIHWQM